LEVAEERREELERERMWIVSFFLLELGGDLKILGRIHSEIVRILASSREKERGALDAKI
jgi:hypothetical protein